jgi:hypothetical protein
MISMRGGSTAGERVLSSPITGIVACCAWATVDQVTAPAPPSSVMNARRFIQ